MADQPGGLAAALAALQTNLPRIGKDAAAIVPTKSGGSYGYKYADLATITKILMPKLGELGLSFMAIPDAGPGDKFYLRCILQHKDGGQEVGLYPLPASGTPQAIGSAITYARRYALLAMTGAAPDEDDDDAQAAEDDARRLYLRAPETRPDGSATEAEIMRMQRGPVPGVERSQPSAPERTEWDAEPDTKADPRTSGMRAMFALYKELGVTDKEPMLEDISAIIGRPVASRSDLEMADVTTVNVMLRRRRDRQRAGKEPADA